MNAAERLFLTFKAHLLSTLSVIAKIYPITFWDLLLPQTELTLNLIQQATLTSEISAWGYFQGPFDYKVTPTGPLVCLVVIHRKYPVAILGT